MTFIAPRVKDRDALASMSYFSENRQQRLAIRLIEGKLLFGKGVD